MVDWRAGADAHLVSPSLAPAPAPPTTPAAQALTASHDRCAPACAWCGQGKLATHAIVWARLIIHDKDYGVHPFMVQIR